METEYSVEVQPLVLLKLNNIPEKRFGWRSSSALGMPLVWLEEGLAQRFQVPAGGHLELRLIDAKTEVLVDGAKVKLADYYTTMHPRIERQSRQVKPAVLEISGELKRDGEHPYTATLRRLDTPSPIVREKPANPSGGYRPPRNASREDLEEDEEPRGRRIIVPLRR